MIMMSAINRQGQSSPLANLSKPRAVYSIDQILGNHNHHRRNNINGKLHVHSLPPNREMLHIYEYFHNIWLVTCRLCKAQLEGP